jgi:hypothetical protein
MRDQLTTLLFALQKYQNQLVIVYICLIALTWQFWMKTRTDFIAVALIRMATAVAVSVTAAYTLTITYYLLFPNYFDHGQPLVSIISYLWMQRQELYPNWTSNGVYGLPYGPIFFLINGLTLLVSPTVLASKLPGVLSLGAALTFTLILLKRKTNSYLMSFLLLASLILLFVPFGIYSYWNRPDPLLLLVTVLALLLASSSSSLVTILGIGVLTGLAAGFKLHGFIYTLPAALVALERVRPPRSRAAMAVISGGLAAAALLLPYLASGAAISGYLGFLRVALDHGWSRPLFSANLHVAFVLTVPIIGIWFFRQLPLHASDRLLLVGLCASVALITAIGAKPGGGPYYLLPLAPICIYGIAVVLPSPQTNGREVAAMIFVVLFLAHGAHLFLFWDAVKFSYQVASVSERLRISELNTYTSLYPDAQIGISDDQHYPDYFYRVLVVFNGRPLVVDFSAWMDLAYAGADEKYVLRFITTCNIPIWILPSGAPFTKTNNYTKLPMLSDNFRAVFSSNYRQIALGRYYQVWSCKALICQAADCGLAD